MPTSHTQGGTVRSVLSSVAHEFGLRLWQTAAPPYGQFNICFSPLSPFILLLMVSAGADENTKAELLQVLGLSGAADAELVDQFEKFRVDLFTVPGWMKEGHFAEWWQSNAMFCSRQIQLWPNYQDMCSRWFSTPVTQVDFRLQESVEVINRWAAQETSNHVQRLLSQPPGEITCLLAGAMYFFDLWEVPFNFEQSTYRPFYLADGSQIRLDTMCRFGMQRFLENAHFQAVKLPYKDPRFCLYCFMPHERDGARQIMSFLLQPGWWRQFGEENLELWLPRFSFNFNATLKQTLLSAGLQSVFRPGAGLNRIGHPLHIDEVIQQVNIRVDEVGVEAATKSDGASRTRSNSATRKTIAFDRPFFFVLQHEFAATPIFLGMVSRPQ